MPLDAFDPLLPTVFTPILKAQLLLIALCSALLVHCVYKKTQNKMWDLVGIPLLGCVGFFFGDNDSFQIRIAVLSFLLLSYILFAILLRLLSFMISLLKHHWPSADETQAKNSSNLTVQLPLNHTFTIEQKFIEDFPANVSLLVQMSNDLRVLTDSFKKNYKHSEDDAAKEECVKSYFLGLCYHLATLFERDTRVHVRILKGGGYQKYIATCDSNRYEKSMRTMSIDNKMIHNSFVYNCSLVKTLNTGLHEDGSNRRWKNYLMFALPQITHDGRPVFSMGISITRKKHDLFFFLNYCEIESIIGNYIDDILSDKDCDLAEFIERYHFAST